MRRRHPDWPSDSTGPIALPHGRWSQPLGWRRDARLRPSDSKPRSRQAGCALSARAQRALATAGTSRSERGTRAAAAFGRLEMQRGLALDTRLQQMQTAHRRRIRRPSSRMQRRAGTVRTRTSDCYRQPRAPRPVQRVAKRCVPPALRRHPDLSPACRPTAGRSRCSSSRWAVPIRE